MIRAGLKAQRGDTLIEVLIAISILSMAVVLAQASMNYGQSIALRSVERTSVQSTMNSQLSYIRYARDAYLDDEASAGGQFWQNLTDNFVDTSAVADEYCLPGAARPAKEQLMFYIDEDVALAAGTDTPAEFSAALKAYPLGGVGANPVPAEGAARPGNGMWIIARGGGSAPTEYIDFYVRSCWGSLVDAPNEQTSFVMRLYVSPESVAVASPSPFPGGCAGAPTDIALTLDFSSSMVNSTWETGVSRSEKLREMAVEFVETTMGVAGYNREAIIVFNSNATIAAPFGSTSDELKAAINNAANEVGTNFVSALDVSRETFEDSSEGIARALVFISDGQVYSAGQEADSRAIATDMKTSELDVAVYTIGIVVDTTNDDLLNDIAGNGGSYFSTENQTEFESAMRGVAADFACA